MEIQVIIKAAMGTKDIIKVVMEIKADMETKVGMEVAMEIKVVMEIKEDTEIKIIMIDMVIKGGDMHMVEIPKKMMIVVV